MSNEQVGGSAGGAVLPGLPDFCWPVDTSCVSDWDEEEGGQPIYSTAVKATAVALAGQSMRLLTGFRIGGCPVTIRPCRQGCTDPTWRTYPARYGASTPWYPVQLGGSWLNIGCGAHLGACGCTTISEVRLYGPVGLIESVTLDGATLASSAYRLDSGGRLVRTDGDLWPLCQNLSAPDTEPNTWAVTYTPGIPVDGLGAAAAGLLAGEFAAACTAGRTCRLPAGVQTIARGGVQMTLTPGVFPDGRTGIHMVDAYLDGVNPNRLKQPSTVWSPDLRRARRTL